MTNMTPARKIARIARPYLPALVLGAALVLGFGAYARASMSSNNGGTRLGSHHRARRPKLILTIGPGQHTLAAGATAQYRIVVRRVRFRGKVKIAVIGRLPAGVSVRFAPRTIKTSRTVLTIRTSTTTPAGSYRLALRASRGKLRGRAVLSLMIAGTGGGGGSVTPTLTSYGLSGNVPSVLWPGQPQGIDVSIANPNSEPIEVTSLTVSVAGVDAPRASASLPCSTSDFTVQQYSSSYPLVIPPSATLTLAQLGVPASDWPQLELVDTTSDQDGCQGASLSLAYGGSATPG